VLLTTLATTVVHECSVVTTSWLYSP
jgi:hypothetical protein